MIFIEEYAQKTARELSEEDAPKFDTRFVAMGFEVEHEAFMKALNKHLNELNEYGSVEVSNDHATINAAQAIALQGFTEGFNSAIASLFAEHLLYRTLWAFYWKLPLGAPLYEEFGGIGRAVDMYYEMLTEGHVVSKRAA